MVVVFPQNMYTFFLLMNPLSCWSTSPNVLGDENYYNKNGLQPQALKAVIERVLAPTDSETYDYLSNNIADEEPVPLSQNPLLGTYYFVKNFGFHAMVGFFYLLGGWYIFIDIKWLHYLFYNEILFFI